MKGCLLICNKNAVSGKDTFPFIKDKILTIGYTIPKDYDQPPEDEPKSLQGLTRWITTLATPNKPPLVLTSTYSPEKYPKYDNYDAINVDSIKDIPYDYEGVIGCPITILEKNLDNVVIKGRGGDIEWAETECDFYTPPTEDKAKEYKADNETWRIQNPYLLVNDKPVMPYNRVFIKIEGLLYGEYTEIDGEYIKRHRPILNGKQMYSRVLIKHLPTSKK